MVSYPRDCTPRHRLTYYSFLEGPKAALVASRDFNFGHYTSPPEAGLRAFGRVYSAWAYGQTVNACSLRIFHFADCHVRSGTVSTAT